MPYKGIDALNIGNILNHKEVTKHIPVYFKYQTTPKISYTYTRSVASKLFNYKDTIRDFNIHDHQLPTCSCSSSPYLYSPAGHVITGNLNIVDNLKLKDLLSKGPKYREAKSFNWKFNFKLVMDSVEDYARRWSRDEEAELDSLSEWIKAIRRLLKRKMFMACRHVNNKPKSVFNDHQVISNLADLHDHYVIVPADKAPNNVVFVCKTNYLSYLKKELDLDDSTSSITYQHTSFTKNEILANHRSVLSSLNVNTIDKDMNLPLLHWIPKLHKNPYKQRFIAGSSNCSTKALSKLLTSVLTTVKEGLQKYCDVVYSHSGINQMWILKNSKQLLENLQSQSSHINSIRTFDFSTLYTTIPHDKLKSRLCNIIRQAFRFKNGKKRYEYIVVGYNSTYFVKDHSNAKHKYTENDIVRMIDFLIDNIFVECGGEIFQQVIGIRMGTNCAPLLADLFLYSYEAEFIQTLIKSGKRQLAKSFNFTFRYIDDVLSLNNSKFSDYINDIYPEELDIKETTDNSTSSSFLDLLLEFDDNRLRVKIYDKRDDFDLNIVNYPFICGNIPHSPSYGVYISQLIRYARASTLYDDFVSRSSGLTSKLLRQGYKRLKLIDAFKKFYGRHNTLVDNYKTSVTTILSDLFLETLYRS